MKITLRAVRKGACDYEKVKRLYHRSFPASERAPFPQLMHWSDGRRAQMYALYAENGFGGRDCADAETKGKCGVDCADMETKGKCGVNCADVETKDGCGVNCADTEDEGGCDGINFGNTENKSGKSGGEWLGLAYFVQYRDIVYLFYLAIDETKQGKGFGSALLTAVRRHFAGKRVILNIEALETDAPNYEERVKRKRFYERNGFHEMGYTVKELGVVYEMLGMGETVSINEYIALMRSVIGRLGAWYIYRGQEEK